MTTHARHLVSSGVLALSFLLAACPSSCDRARGPTPPGRRSGAVRRGATSCDRGARTRRASPSGA